MKKMMKKWKSMSLIVWLLVIGLSMTVFATELTSFDSDGLLITEADQNDGQEDGQDDNQDNDPSENPIYKFDENYRIELVNPEDVFEYNGEEFKPEIQVFRISEEMDETEGILKEVKEEIPADCYKVEYKDNINAGTATIDVTGIEEKGYSDTINAEFTIVPRSLNNAKVSLAGTTYVHDGKVKNPAVTVLVDGVALKAGEEFKASYSNNCEVGTAYVTVEGVGNYTGSHKLTYSIILKKPIIATTPNYDRIKVAWYRITSASGYEVLRSTVKNKGYKTIASFNTWNVSNYTDKNVTFNKTYYYKVRAYRMVNGKKVYAEDSAVLAQKVQPGKTAISKVSRSSATSLKITWNKVSGASGYAVYRSTSEKGNYERIATVKKNKTFSYTDKKCSCGKTYYYKVRAYRTVNKKNYYGSYSAVKSGCATPGKVTWNNTSTSYNSTSVTLKWKKVSEATGYEIYRSTVKNGTYTKVKTISKNSTLSWKNTGLKKGVVYYYKIRSYKQVGKKQIYSAYSSVFTKSIAGWKYVDGYKLYYNNSGKLVKDVSNIIGKQDSYVIKINKKKNTVTVYAKDGNNGYIIPVKAFICSTGAATPLGTFKTPQKLRWHTLDGPSYGQWCTRITGHILFHSVWYYKPKNTTLSVAQYNKLGTQASHGCVRLTAADAKWIYDNCKLKTKVTIYNSSDPGPLGKPTAYKLKSWHTWDPTDPNTKSKCAKKGCH